MANAGPPLEVSLAPAVPTVSSVTPAQGTPAGDTFVRVTGTGFYTQAAHPGSVVKVKFGSAYSPEVGVVSSTTLIARTPPLASGEPGPVAVTVENRLTAGSFPEPGSLAGGFTYKRPSIATPPSLTNHSIVALVTRALLDQLSRCVIKNVAHDAHPEYADAESALAPQESQADAPCLKVVGPTISEDPEHREQERQSVETVDGFDEVRPGVPARLTFEIVGVGTTNGEATNLWREVVRFLKLTPELAFTHPSGEAISYELAPEWDRRGQFQAQVTRQGVFQWTLGLQVRGVQEAAEKVWEGRAVEEDVAQEYEPL